MNSRGTTIKFRRVRSFRRDRVAKASRLRLFRFRKPEAWATFRYGQNIGEIHRRFALRRRAWSVEVKARDRCANRQQRKRRSVFTDHLVATALATCMSTTMGIKAQEL